MTDKELKRLSRLELLELLLRERRENERLKADLDKLKSEKNIEKTTIRLEETAEQFNTSFQNIEPLVSVIQKFVTEAPSEEDSVPDEMQAPKDPVPENTESTEEPCVETASDPIYEKPLEDTTAPKRRTSVDADIYRRIMRHYYRNLDQLFDLPDDLRKDITDRMIELQERSRSTKSDPT